MLLNAVLYGLFMSTGLSGYLWAAEKELKEQESKVAAAKKAEPQAPKPLCTDLAWHTLNPDLLGYLHSARTVVKIWDARTKKKEGSSFKGAKTPIGKINFTCDGLHLIGALAGGIVCWDMRTSNMLKQHTIPGKKDAVPKKLMCNPTNEKSCVLLCDKDKHLDLLNPVDGTLHARLYLPEPTEDWFTHVDFSPNGAQIVTCTHEGKVNLWDARTLRRLKPLNVEPRAVKCATFLNDAMVAIGTRRGFGSFSVVTGEGLYEYYDEARSLKWLADDTTHLVSHPQGELVLVQDNSLKVNLYCYKYHSVAEISPASNKVLPGVFAWNSTGNTLALSSEKGLKIRDIVVTEKSAPVEE